MKEIRCPFCGRENTRGKYCMFCGNPLAGGEPVRIVGKASGRKEDGERWDPETVYVQSRGKAIALFAAITVLIACVAAVLLIQQRTPGVSYRAFAAPLGTPGASGMEEMIGMLTNAGMSPVGDTYKFNDTIYQQFGPFSILDENTSYSIAAIQDGTEMAVAHAFDEEAGVYTIRRQGPVFARLLEKLTKKYGKPVIRGTQDYYYWTEQSELLTLYYSYKGEIRLEFHEEIQTAAVQQI